MREVHRSEDDEANKLAAKDNKATKSWKKGKLIDIYII